MNINIGDQSSIIKYIQSILIEYYSPTVRLSGIYDSFTHECMKKFLETPNIIETQEVISNFFNKYDKKSGFSDLFIKEDNLESIKFITKTQNENPVISTSMLQRRNSLCEFFESYGWKILDFNCYLPPYYFSIKKNESIFNEIPKKELVCMINQFDKKFYYDKCISYSKPDSGNIIIDKSSSYKLAIIECSENEIYHITHNYSSYAEILVSCCNISKEKLLNNFNKGIIDDSVVKIEKFSISPNELIEYKTSSSAKCLVIQIPYFNIVKSRYSRKATEVIESQSVKITDLLIIKGVTDNDLLCSIPYSSFISNPWYIHDRFLSYIMRYSITEYSPLEDIDYAQKLVNKYDSDMYRIDSVSKYEKSLKDYVKSIQLGNNTKSSIKIEFLVDNKNIRPENYVVQLYKKFDDGYYPYGNGFIPSNENNYIITANIDIGSYYISHRSSEGDIFNGINEDNSKFEIKPYYMTYINIPLTYVSEDKPEDNVTPSISSLINYKGMKFALGYIDKEVEQHLLENTETDGEVIVVG